ncbi:TPA: hypothetical protein MG510_16535 [Klebsiella pneumoniae]|uniref:hypothetical protein n=1 Tax=Klebsiella pneumoniae complex TaxID=3390273 RepID=UPI0014643A3A|nr:MULTISPECIES: hypothetical protein [Klebsiella]MCQ0814401.1 hypothetical protein [Klebsiella pneumoniae]MDE4678729.1 hypothetical protein [Klebsiella variicola]MEC6347219.1 hypothetical protein [Klebsiella pneumoniae]QJK23473.1 hypothetical protein HJX28_16120 [Klebsiella pneumoniae]HBR2129043.1 hypothetical protein [Klebsiella variicola]
MTTDEINKFLNKIDAVENETSKVEEGVDALEANSDNTRVRDGKTRSTLTLTFMIGFFGILIFSCLFVFLYNWAAVNWTIHLSQAKLEKDALGVHLLEVDKILSIMIGALGTSLGFIIGYYFKEKHS